MTHSKVPIGIQTLSSSHMHINDPEQGSIETVRVPIETVRLPIETVRVFIETVRVPGFPQ
jgi:hypothetical protein